MSGAASGLFGAHGGDWFAAPGWVDVRKPAGTSLQRLSSWSAWAQSVATFKHMLFSPNLIWFLAAAAVWTVFPYDMNSAKTLSLRWMMQRAVINLGLVYVYYGFWVGATQLKLERKFRPDMAPSAINRLHNVWYTTLGTLQWTVWEVLFVWCFASGRLAFVPASELRLDASCAWMLAREALAAGLIPIWRSFHFYWAHRLIHVPFLYRNVHSLHHRNVDIEPFAGLSMHPVEHLYYFSCVAPSLLFRLSPFQMLWNGVHLLLSPGASHSGWEDHVQSDQFHYVHHAKFNCNYGSGSLPLDVLFGTFENTLHSVASAKKARAKADCGEKSARGAFVPKASTSFQLYMVGTCAIMAFAVIALLGDAFVAPASPFASTLAWAKAHARESAALIAYGPVVLAALVTALSGARLVRTFDDTAMKGDGLAPRLRLPAFVVQCVVGMAVGVAPVYYLAAAALAPTPE